MARDVMHLISTFLKSTAAYLLIQGLSQKVWVYQKILLLQIENGADVHLKTNNQNSSLVEQAEKERKQLRTLSGAGEQVFKFCLLESFFQQGWTTKNNSL